jgi:hypothetical protein
MSLPVCFDHPAMSRELVVMTTTTFAISPRFPLLQPSLVQPRLVASSGVSAADIKSCTAPQKFRSPYSPRCASQLLHFTRLRPCSDGPGPCAPSSRWPLPPQVVRRSFCSRSPRLCGSFTISEWATIRRRFLRRRRMLSQASPRFRCSFEVLAKAPEESRQPSLSWLFSSWLEVKRLGFSARTSSGPARHRSRSCVIARGLSWNRSSRVCLRQTVGIRQIRTRAKHRTTNRNASSPRAKPILDGFARSKRRPEPARSLPTLPGLRLLFRDHDLPFIARQKLESSWIGGSGGTAMATLGADRAHRQARGQTKLFGALERLELGVRTCQIGFGGCRCVDSRHAARDAVASRIGFADRSRGGASGKTIGGTRNAFEQGSV